MTKKITITSLIVFCAAILILAAYGTNRMVNLSPQTTVTVWKYKGHDMLRYDYNGEVSVCHSPECRKCIQVYD